MNDLICDPFQQAGHMTAADQSDQSVKPLAKRPSTYDGFHPAAAGSGPARALWRRRMLRIRLGPPLETACSAVGAQVK
jgi:hypothetical protein